MQQALLFTSSRGPHCVGPAALHARSTRATTLSFGELGLLVSVAEPHFPLFSRSMHAQESRICGGFRSIPPTRAKRDTSSTTHSSALRIVLLHVHDSRRLCHPASMRITSSTKLATIVPGGLGIKVPNTCTYGRGPPLSSTPLPSPPSPHEKDQ